MGKIGNLPFLPPDKLLKEAIDLKAANTALKRDCNRLAGIVTEKSREIRALKARLDKIVEAAGPFVAIVAAHKKGFTRGIGLVTYDLSLYKDGEVVSVDEQHFDALAQAVKGAQ